MLAVRAIMEQRSAPPSLSTWNDIATILGVPLGAILTLVGIMLMVKHHREARRQGEASSLTDIESFAATLSQDARHPDIHPDITGAVKAVCRHKLTVDTNAASSCGISLPPRAFTRTGVSSKVRPSIPARASTHAGTTRRPRDPSLPFKPPPSRVSSRASQITLVDDGEYTNPTMIIAYPNPAVVAPENQASGT